MEVITLLLVVLAGVAKGIMDSLQFHYERSIYSKLEAQHWWNPKLSWKNKYKDLGHTKIANLVEKLDNTVFVFFTDAWHCFQMVFLTSLFLGVVFYTPILGKWYLDFILLRILFGASFEVIYKIDQNGRH